jgi:enamine deaminase RidA (YjgF/YER057c/UK114 family)
MTATDVYKRLDRLGIALPPPPMPVANFHTHAEARGLLFLSGQGPVQPDGSAFTGTVGDDVTVEAAYAHARLVGINLLAVMHHATGDLNRIARIVKLLGMVNAAPGFADHPKVINGCSDLFVEVFGAAGQHARSAVGMGSLPGRITVEIEGVAELRDG